MNARPGFGIDALLSRILHYGGLVSAAVLLIGLLLLIPSRGVDRATIEQLRAPSVTDAAPLPTVALINGALHGQAVAVILVGMLLLMLTPVARVIAAGIYYARRRDRPFATIAILVVTLLIVGVLMGRLGVARSPSRTSRAAPELRLTL